ncbi:MAG: HEAT repeat domain-containing protein [Pyrinomonadaceae bacterium]
MNASPRLRLHAALVPASPSDAKEMTTNNATSSTSAAAVATNKTNGTTAASRPHHNKAMKNSAHTSTKLIRISSALLLTGAVALTPSVAQHSKDMPVNVTSISTRRTAQGGVVTLTADTPLNKTQTWQDAEGFHVTLPYAGQSPVKGGAGVKVRRVGNSLEVVVPVRAGASVMVQPRFNHLDLVVNGDAGFANGNDTQALPSARAAQQSARVPQQNVISSVPTTARLPRLPRERRSQMSVPPAQASIAQPAFAAQGRANDANNASFPTVVAGASSPSNYSGAPNAKTGATLPDAAKNTPAPPVNSATASNTSSSSTTPPALPVVAAPANNAATLSTAAQAKTETTDDGGLFAFLFSTTGVILAGALGLVTFLVLKRRKNSGFEDVEFEETSTDVATTTPKAVAVSDKPTGEQRKIERRKKWGRRKDDVTGVLVASNPVNAENLAPQRQPASAANNAQAYTTTELFGAYRVDQEVGKLVLGQPHRMDVLSSRAPDDRRALEVSLLKALTASDTGEDGRRRTRVALEEYGFVARQSAALLLAPDAYERASAAQTLGEIGSPASLQFLLEALYDAEAIVRTRAVESLGALQLPSAIGALLDMARRHPEMPAALLSRALSACSVDTFDIFGTDAAPPARALLSVDAGEPFTGDITNLEPAAVIEQLPEWLEDEALVGALNDAENPDAEIRAIAARALAQFQVQRSVAALTELASRDAEASVRAAAVTSLGAIDHESVFAPVIIAFGDEAREVRAAAARSLSRLNFDRADAYVRVAETADAETMREVARACIKAGMAGQAIDRLASEDRRPAYEAFSLLSLLAKSGETAPITDAIEHHADMNVRLSAVRLLGLAGGTEAAGRLRQLAVRDSVPEKVRSAVLEVVYKMDQAQIV